MLMDEQVMQIVKLKGPLLPIVVTKELKTNTIFAAAQLSSLVDKKKLKITSVKKGGSPFYYAEGQEQKLEQLSEHLNKKDQDTFKLLKTKKVLKDSEQTPLARVGLREIKDYAKPLNVTFNGKKQLFWKYYLVTDEEAGNLIKKQIGIKEEKPKVQEQPKVQEKQKIEEPQKSEAKAETETKKEAVPAEPKIKQEQEKIKTQKQEKIIEKPEVVKEKPKEELPEKTIEEKQEKIVEPEVVKEKPAKKTKEKPKDKFLEKIEKHFENKNIEIKDFEIIKKNSEIEMIVRVPSAVGTSQYYCRAKNKKRITEGDLSTAYIKAQKRQMPALFLTPGQLNKEAEKMLENEFKDELTLQKI